MPPSLHKSGLVLSLVILLGGSILQTFLGTSGGQPPQIRGVDDAYISYRYARNIARGQGAVFNPGERVEGYSNFLYTLLMVPCFWVVGNDGAFLFSTALNLACSVLLLWFFMSSLRERLGEQEAALGGLLLSLCLPLWAAVASGMETCLVLLLGVAIWFRVEREVQDPQPSLFSLLSVLMILSLLVRADGFVVPALAILYIALKRGVRRAAACALPLAAAFASFETWRYLYYGNWLPNTYYVKVSGPLGSRITFAGEQLASLALRDGLLPYLAVFLYVLKKAVTRKTPPARALSFDPFFVLGWIAYWFYIGGDNLGDRFLLILFPLGIFILLRELQGHPGLRRATVLLGLVLLYQLAGPLVSDRRFRYSTDRYDAWINLGKFLAREYPHHSLATGGIGKIPYFSDAYTLDMLGIADPVIAHEPVAASTFFPGHSKFDADYILSRKPDLLVGWIQPDGNMILGFTKTKYQAAGYQLKYLAYMRRRSPPASIIAASGISGAELRRKVEAGYQYAVLARR